eukprot:Colp12_sorted_trinity150504_noHs@10145
MAPTYELSMIVQPLLKPNVVANLLENATKHVIGKGGIVRKAEHLGARDLPYRMRAHLQYFYQGRYLLMEFDASPENATTLCTLLKRNQTVIRHTLLKKSDRCGTETVS